MSTTPRALHASSRLRRGILLMATCGSFALLSACQKDADLANSQKAAEELQDISRNYSNELAKLTHDADIDQVASRLEGFARSAKSVTGTSPAQKKSATTLAATIAFAAGGLRASEFTQIELAQMSRRNVIATNTSSAMIIAAGAIERSNTSFTEAGNDMALERKSFEAQSEEIGDRLSEHQSNAAQLRQQQQRTSQQLNQMTLDAARLGRQANDSGPIEAYPLIEESAEIRARMIPVKAKVADAESQLALIEPQVASTNTERTNVTAMIEATLRAERNITLMGEVVNAAGDAGKQRAATQARNVEQLVTEYLKINTDSVQPIFASALSNLEQAQRSGTTKAARALVSVASRMVGDLQAMRAHTAMAEARLFKALASAAEMTGVSAETWNTKASAAAEEETSAREAARSAYEDALDKLASAGGSEDTRARIERLIMALDGTQTQPDMVQMQQTPAATMSSAPSQAAGGGNAGSGFMGMGTRGFASPDELLVFLSGFQQTMSNGAPAGAMQQIMGVMYLEDPQVLMQDPQAMQATLSSMSSQPSDSGQPSAKVVGLEDTRAELSISNMPVNIPLIKVDGKWYINLSQWLEDAKKYQSNGGGRGSTSGGEGRSGRGGGGGRSGR